MNHTYKCPKCESENMSKLDASSDESGCDRPDYFCTNCNTRFRMSASGFSIVSESFNYSKIADRNRELETTLRTIINLKELDIDLLKKIKEN